MSGKPTYEQLEQRVMELEKAEFDRNNRELMPINDENSLSPVFQKHDAVMLLIEPDSGAIVDANIAAQNYYGYSGDILKGMSIQDINALASGEVAERRKQAVNKNLNFFIFPHRLSNGEIRTVEVHSSPVILKGRKLLLSIINDITDRVYFGEALKDVNKTLQQMLDGTQDMIAFQKPDHTVIRYNRAGYEWLGMSPEEVDGKKCYELIGREKECEICSTGNALKSKRIETIEKYHPEFNRYIKAVSNPVLNDEGEIIYIIEQVTDISSQKLAEDKLRNNQLLLSEITSQIPGVLFQFYARSNGEMGLYYISEGTKSLFGVEPDINGSFEYFTEMVIPEHREAFIGSIEKAIKNISEWHFEGILEKATGERIWFSAHSIPTVGENEIVFNGLIQDITKRKRTEEELIEANDKYSALFNQSTEGIYLHDLDGRITDVNETACLQTGYSREELQKLNVFDLHPKKADTINLRKEEVLRQWRQWRPGQGSYVETEHQRKDGTVMPVHLTTYRVRFGNNDQLMAVTRDIAERKKAEEAIRESEKRHRTIIETATDGFILSDFKGNLLQVNNAYCKMSGYSEEELLSMKISDFETIESQEEIENKLHEIIEKGYIRFESKHRRKDGSIFDVDVSVTLHSKKEETIVSFLRDITERKNVELALKESEEKWRNILINTPQIGVSLNPGAEIIFANEHFLELTGWKEKEVIGRNWFDMFIPENIREEVKEIFKTLMKQGDTTGFSNYESEIVGKSGEIYNIAWSNVLTKDKMGNIVDVTCLGVDLTERKRAEEVLKKSEIKYRSMMQAIKDPVYISSKEKIIQYMNNAMLEFIGHDARGEKCHKALYGFSSNCSWCDAEKIFRTGHSEKNVITPKDKRFYNVSSSKFINADGAELKISVLRDMTEFKALQERLQQSQKMESIGTLAGGIAHDFNNILSPIMMNAELAMYDLQPDDPLQFNMKEIYGASERARDLVKQILTFARKQPEKKILLKASLIIKEATKFLRSTIPTTIDIQYNNKAEQDTVLADPTQLNQIVMNLCTNAAYAMRENGGLLEITLDNKSMSVVKENGIFHIKPGSYLSLSVRDTGPGMPLDIIDRIFEPYYTTKEPGEGTGLGLATIHGIVQNYGGSISVESKVGKGTIFDVYLPLFSVAISGTDEDKPEIPKGNERILIVDDEKPVLNVMKKMLERIGYKITTRTNSMEALETFRNDTKAFDLVITDMTMPNMTGENLTKEIMAIKPGIPVILCTGFSDKVDENKAKEIGISSFVMKPIVMSEMAKTIREVLDKNNNLPDTK